MVFVTLFAIPRSLGTAFRTTSLANCYRFFLALSAIPSFRATPALSLSAVDLFVCCLFFALDEYMVCSQVFQY